MGKMSRVKGKVFERLARGFFADRMVDYEHHGTNEPDLIISIYDKRLGVECKNQKEMRLSAWWKQAEEAALEHNLDGCVVFHKRAGKTEAEDQWVTMTARTFKTLASWAEPF